MPYAFTLTTKIPASAQEVYEAWLDSLAHSEMTGGEASMSEEIGAEVSAWDGYIRGRNLELIPGERIVQSWRTTEFGDEHADSIVTITLEEVDDGTLLTLEHSNVPDEQRSYEESGWQEYYFEPMVAYFAERPAGDAKSPKVAAPKGRPRRTARSASKRAPKPTRAVRSRLKRAAPRATPSAGTRKAKRKSARIVAAAAKRKGRKPARRRSKSGRSKRR
ncbi:MAG TPA: SRPBCC domain-containing protein [Xanthobacteraceae bacterium]|nr:SRPBCC domain-containing protein [Xanthobacteraceae bacterium]